MSARVEEVYAFLMVQDGQEGVPVVELENGQFIPLFAADRMLVEVLLRPFAEQEARRTGQPITLARFTTRSEVEVISPQAAKGAIQ